MLYVVEVNHMNFCKLLHAEWADRYNEALQ
jgi:hypothetical protein